MMKKQEGRHFPIPQAVQDLKPDKINIISVEQKHHLTRDEREYMCDLSMKVFGTRNKWTKAYNHGVPQTMTEKMEDGSERKYKGLKYGTLEEIKKELEMLWDEKQKEEQKAKETAQKVEEARENTKVDVEPQQG